MPVQLIQLFVLVLFCFMAGLAARNSFTRMMCQRQARKLQQERPQPVIYEIGSPEFNHQVVDAIRVLNQQLADQGKRIPEKTAIHIIHLVGDEYGTQQPESE